jgi:hypothetical protein
MWSIRRATDNDVVGVAHLMTQLGYETSEADMRNRLEGIFAEAQ